MREKTSQILQSYFKCINQDGDEESRKRAIIETAARLIKSDIKINVPSTPMNIQVLMHNDLCSQLLLFMPSQVVIRPPGFLVLVRRQLSKSL